jgi:hypothetical protein
MAILLACARLRLQPADAARIHAAAGRGVDWEHLWQLAEAHKLVPLVQHHVATGALPVPSAPRSALKTLAAANGRRALMLTAALLEVVDMCGAEGIPVVPLKGPLLAQHLYGAVAMRQARDLDLLVRQADVARLVRLLQVRGYQLRQSETADLDAFAVKDLHHLTVVEPLNGIRLEIHYWLLRPRGRRSHGFDDITPWLRPAAFYGRKVQVLDDEALLVYLCEHGAEHTWGRLEWLAGVNELGRRVDPARAAGSEFARALGTSKRVRAAMELASRLLAGAPAPASRDLIATRLVTRRLRREPDRVLETSAERFFYGLFTDASAGAIARRCWTMLLAPSVGDQRAMPLPRWLLPLHWLVRPFRLIARRLGQRRA